MSHVVSIVQTHYITSSNSLHIYRFSNISKWLCIGYCIVLDFEVSGGKLKLCKNQFVAVIIMTISHRCDDENSLSVHRSRI